MENLGNVMDIEYSVRLTLDETFQIRAADEEDAEAKAWDIVFSEGAAGIEVKECESCPMCGKNEPHACASGKNSGDPSVRL